MKQIFKVRFVIGVSIEQDTEFTPDVVRRIWTYENIEQDVFTGQSELVAYSTGLLITSIQVEQPTLPGIYLNQ